MTRALSEELNICYTLLFTGDSELKRGCHIKALLCFEDCRKTAEGLLKNDSVYAYCFYRALRKEAQLLRVLGLNKRAYKVLSKVNSSINNECSSIEKLFVLLQLYDLSEEFEPSKTAEYFRRLNIESEKLKS